MPDYVKKYDVVQLIWDKPDMTFDEKQALGRRLSILPPEDVAPVKRGHWYMLAYDEAVCSCCGYDRNTPFDSTREAKEKWGELPPYCEMCGAILNQEATT